MIGLIGVLLALGLLIGLAYRGMSILILAPLMALLAALFAVGTPLIATYTQVFMTALGGFVVQYFPLFLLGALFGKLMEDSGAAESIAQGIVGKLGVRHSLLAVVLACAVLTYGGVSLFVVAFAVYPIASALFRRANIPKRLIPATIALGAFTFTMTALPGTPAIQNAIPMPYFGTTPFAAPILGIITASVMFGLGQWWLSRQAHLAAMQGEGYGEHPDAKIAQSSDMTANEAKPNAHYPAFSLALLPIILVISLNYGLSTYWLPTLDTSYLSSTHYGATTMDAVRGIWSIIISLSAASVVLIILFWSRFKALLESIAQGANDSVQPIFNTASLVGFGAVIASLPAFELIRQFVDSIGGGNPLISLAIATNILAGITGSASGGMSIALQTLGADYLQLSQQLGIAPDLLHRVTTVATGGLDSLPHNGAVVTLLAICGLTHKQAYKDIFMVAVAFPLLALVLLIILGMVFGSF